MLSLQYFVEEFFKKPLTYLLSWIEAAHAEKYFVFVQFFFFNSAMNLQCMHINSETYIFRIYDTVSGTIFTNDIIHKFEPI